MPPTTTRAAVLLAASLMAAVYCAAAQTGGGYAHALRLRAALDATPRATQTAAQYGRILHAFRAVYHADRADPNAAASVEAVAELLAEEGRVLHNPGLLRSAVEQLEFLRRDFSASAFAASALLTEGEIEKRDLHDEQAARVRFSQFAASYPRSPLAPQARAELRQLGGAASLQAAALDLDHETSDERSQQVRVEDGTSATGSGSRFSRERASTGATGSPNRAEQSRAEEEPATPASVIHGVPIYRTTAIGHKAGGLAIVTGIRHWSTADYTRIAIDVRSEDGDEPPFEASRVSDPDRIFFDLHNARLSPGLAGHAVTVTDGGYLERIRAAQFSGDVVRVVLDVSDVSDYSAFWLPNPSRLIIDVHGRAQGVPPIEVATAATPEGTAPHTPASRESAAGTPKPRSSHAAAPGTFVSEVTAPALQGATKPGTGDSVAAIAALSRRPSRVRATAMPTTQPIAAGSPENAERAPKPRKRRKAASDELPAASPTPGSPTEPAALNAGGDRSMTRALGLKINRIVIDAGHGGHDSGTLGPGGIEEKDVVLDVALRLGKLLRQRLGADIIYTRDNDTFVPLETRTAIANKARADLFISIHANSSPDPDARGVETYYLNFTTSADALEVAARENAVSDESIHQLSDLVKKITLQDKIAESRDFAADVDGSLYKGLETGNAGLKDRGVKKAPFVVLIGANMPSILAEVSFLTNPDDASELREGAYRQRIADSLYQGVARYVRSLNGARAEDGNRAGRQTLRKPADPLWDGYTDDDDSAITPP